MNECRTEISFLHLAEVRAEMQQNLNKHWGSHSARPYPYKKLTYYVLTPALYILYLYLNLHRLLLPVIRSKSGKGAFSHCGPTLENKLPDDTICSTTVSPFKSKMIFQSRPKWQANIRIHRAMQIKWLKNTFTRLHIDKTSNRITKTFEERVQTFNC